MKHKELQNKKESNGPMVIKLYKEVAIQSKIHMLSGIIEKNIREGYTGGAVDMYIPSLENNPLVLLLRTKIYAYDVNSLYPFVMANNKFPIGNPTYFEGDIRKIEKKPFGFFRCKITATRIFRSSYNTNPC